MLKKAASPYTYGNKYLIIILIVLIILTLGAIRDKFNLIGRATEEIQCTSYQIENNKSICHGVKWPNGDITYNSIHCGITGYPEKCPYGCNNITGLCKRPVISPTLTSTVNNSTPTLTNKYNLVKVPHVAQTPLTYIEKSYGGDTSYGIIVGSPETGLFSLTFYSWSNEGLNAFNTINNKPPPIQNYNRLGFTTIELLDDGKLYTDPENNEPFFRRVKITATINGIEYIFYANVGNDIYITHPRYGSYYERIPLVYQDDSYTQLAGYLPDGRKIMIQEDKLLTAINTDPAKKYTIYHGLNGSYFYIYWSNTETYIGIDAKETSRTYKSFKLPYAYYPDGILEVVSQN